MLLSYTLFHLALSAWTILANYNTERTMSETFIFLSATVGLLILSTIVSMLASDNPRVAINSEILYIIFALLSIGCTLHYDHGKILMYVKDVGYGLATYIFLYMLFVYSPMLKWSKFWFCITGVLIQGSIWYCAVLSIAARITGKGTTAVVSLPGGFLLYTFVLLLWPFFISYITEINSEKRFGHTVYGLQMQYGVLLIYLLISGVGLTICKELTLFAILAITTLLIIACNVRNRVFKIGLIAIGVVGSFFIVKTQPYIRNRVFVWLSINEAIHIPELETTATSTAYYLTHGRRGGFYGEGLGTISETIIPTALTDHAYATISIEYGLIFSVLVLILILLLSRKLYCISAKNFYEYHLALISATIIMASFVLSMAGSVGSFMVSGISPPYIAGGGSLQVLFAYLLAVNVAVKVKVKKEEVL